MLSDHILKQIGQVFYKGTLKKKLHHDIHCKSSEVGTFTEKQIEMCNENLSFLLLHNESVQIQQRETTNISSLGQRSEHM